MDFTKKISMIYSQMDFTIVIGIGFDQHDTPNSATGIGCTQSRQSPGSFAPWAL